MKKTNIKSLIKKTRKKLKWEVREISGPEINTLEIISDPQAREHKIWVPLQDVRRIEYLHELGHATLCERVNGLFSSHDISPAHNQEHLAQIAPACRAASDWFVDQWVFEMAPDEEKAEIEEHLSLVLGHLEHNPRVGAELFCGAALLLAQGHKYCGKKCDLGQTLRFGMQSFLSVNPAQPSVEKLQETINGLLRCYSDLRLTHMVDGQDYWLIGR